MRLIRIALVTVLMLVSSHLAAGQQSDEPGVEALLFFQPFCDQCFAVIDNFLIPMTQEQGDRLRLEPVDVSAPQGLVLYRNALADFGLPEDVGTNPVLLVGDQLLRGEDEIVGRFPQLFEHGLAAGGVTFPDLPGLAAFLEGEPIPEPASEDSLAMGLAWAMFFLLILSVAYTGWTAAKAGLLTPRAIPLLTSPWIPALALLGVGISAYLSYVELGLTEAACGPVGDCNKVQASPYSKILGVPMAYLGVVYYTAVFGLWVLQRAMTGQNARTMAWLLIPAAVFGAVFSIYLTSLELFVIYAVCMWCLGSALITALLAPIVTATAAKR